MHRQFIFALALLLACLAASASVKAQVTAPEQVAVLKEIAEQWPALKSLSRGTWNDSNLEQACVQGKVRFLSACNATGWVRSFSIYQDWKEPFYLGDMAPSLSKMSALYSFLANGVLNGTLDPNLRHLKDLTTLQLIGNTFSTPFPSQWSELTKLTTFEFISSMRQASQPFPSFLSSLPLLAYVTFENANLTGSIPDSFASLPSLSELKLVDIPLLMGPIPTALSQSQTLSLLNLKRLPSFSLTAVGVSSDMPSDWSQATSLHSWYLEDVPITGSLPDKAPPNLYIFNSINVPLGGLFPQAFMDAPMLTECVITNSSISGVLPAVSNITGTKLEILIVSNAQLTGLHEDIISKTLRYLDVSNNLISGTIPSTVGGAESKTSSLNALILSNNSLYGTIPASLFPLTPRLTKISAEHNMLTGSIPIEIAQKTNWAEINFAKNFLNGTIPDAGKWNETQTQMSIYLNENMLEGTIPIALINRTAPFYLRAFRVDNNRLQICNLPKDFVIKEAQINDCKVDQQIPKECGCPGKWPLKCTSGKPVDQYCPLPPVPTIPGGNASSTSISFLAIVIAAFASIMFF